MKEKAVSLLIGVLLALVGIGTVQAVSSALSISLAVQPDMRLASITNASSRDNSFVLFVVFTVSTLPFE